MKKNSKKPDYWAGGVSPKPLLKLIVDDTGETFIIDPNKVHALFPTGKDYNSGAYPPKYSTQVILSSTCLRVNMKMTELAIQLGIRYEVHDAGS